MSFVKLFAEAERQAGGSDSSFLISTVADSSVIISEDEDSNISKEQKNETSVWKSSSHCINHESDNNNSQILHHTYPKFMTSPSVNEVNILFPYLHVNWEHEVYAAMNDEEELVTKPLDGSSELRMEYSTSIPISEIPFECFDTEYVDVEKLVDPLNKVFHILPSNISSSSDQAQTFECIEEKKQPIDQNRIDRRPKDNIRIRVKLRSAAASKWQVSLSHHNIAYSHKNTKPDLLEVELMYFHRPRMIRDRDRPWMIHLTDPSSSSSNHSLSSLLVKRQNSSSSAPIVSSEAERQNLSLAVSSANHQFLVLEYVEEFPPLMLNYGMSSALFNYYRPPLPDDQDRDENIMLMQSTVEALQSSTSRLPRHVQLLKLQSSEKPIYEVDDSSLPRLSLGEVKVLDPSSEDSPFLGRLEYGEVQQSFVNNLFRAPIFKHNPRHSDFLLIRTKVSHKLLTYSIREIPNLFLCGQMEPQRIVPRPNVKINSLQEKFYQLAALRYLQTNCQGVDFTDLQKSILRYCTTSLSPIYTTSLHLLCILISFSNTSLLYNPIPQRKYSLTLLTLICILPLYLHLKLIHNTTSLFPLNP